MREREEKHQIFRIKDFPKNYITTSLCDVLVKAVKIPDTNDLVELFLMDSSGNEMYHEILKDVWKQANLIVAVYDVTREESFGNVSKASTVVIRQLSNVTIMCRNDELSWLFTKRFRAFCLICRK